MIDLTKPIRRKADRRRVTNAEPYYWVQFDGPGGDVFPEVQGDEFERDYENFPEPRKPREWMSAVSAIDCDMVNAYRVTPDRRHEQFLKYVEGPRFRLIEWPVGAELPEWPNE